MEFKTINDFPNYEINKTGEIRNIKTGRIMKPYINPDGYYVVTLVKNKGQAKKMKVHRLVAMVFIANPENKETVDHINRVRTDNNVDNLRWATLYENFDNRICKKKYEITQSKIVEIFKSKDWANVDDFVSELINNCK